MNGYIRTAVVQAALLLAMVIALFSTTFIVDETERAVVIQMGRPTEEITKAGVHFKMPWPIQSVRFLEKRYVMFDARPRDITTRDKKMLLVDDFALLRITDGIQFIAKMQTMENALTRADAIIYGAVRTELGKHNLEEIITSERKEVMDTITSRVNSEFKDFGLEAKIVRITRADLPNDNKPSVYGRMQAERQQMANRYRAEGEERATQIRAETDRDVTTLMANAEKTAQQLRGEGDAIATKVYNESYGKDPAFFAFYRGLQTARVTLGNGGDIRFILNGKEHHLEQVFGKQPAK
jgi:membrane protease subunit HflC